jgi:hypothetical protein
MAAGYTPEQIADNWAACRRYARAWALVGIAVAALGLGEVRFAAGVAHGFREGAATRCPVDPGRPGRP